MGGLPLGGVRRGERDRRAARGVAPRGRQVDCHLPWISEFLGTFLGAAAAIQLHFASALFVVVTKNWQGQRFFLPLLALHPGCIVVVTHVLSSLSSMLYNCCYLRQRLSSFLLKFLRSGQKKSLQRKYCLYFGCLVILLK